MTLPVIFRSYAQPPRTAWAVFAFTPATVALDRMELKYAVVRLVLDARTKLNGVVSVEVSAFPLVPARFMLPLTAQRSRNPGCWKRWYALCSGSLRRSVMSAGLTV